MTPATPATPELQPVPLDQVPIVGALDRDVTADGIVLRRVPAWTRPQLVDPALSLLVTMPAGVRLELGTDAVSIELEVMLTAVQIGDDPVTPPTFDLVVGGGAAGGAGGPVTASAVATDHTTIVIDPRTGAIDFRLGEPATVRFDGLPGDPAVPVEVWLPHAATLELRAVRIPAGATLGPAPAPATGPRRRWAHYGSSISHCLETAHPTETWPAIAARRAGVDLVNLAVAGQCQLDQHVARTIRDLDVDLISVKAGINVVNGDTMRERTYVAALHGFLDTVRDGHPTAPIVVATPIICPAAEDHPGPTLLGDDGRFGVTERSAALSVGALTLRRIRQVMAEVVAARQAAGDPALHLLDGLTLFGPDDVGDLPDGLHPNAAGYRRMGDRFHAAAFANAGPFAASAG